MDLPDDLEQLAERQLGVVSRAQLLEAGLPPGTIRWQSGQRWRSILPGVILLNTGLPTHDQRLVAALLAAGPHSWISGATAATWHGLAPAGATLPIHVLVPFPHRSRRIGWVSIRATKLTNERIVERGPIRVSCRPRALVDAAAQAVDDGAARALVIRAVQDRLVRLDDVQHWVGVRRRNGSTRLKVAVRDAASGAWSVPEAELGSLLRGCRDIPSFWANPRLTDLAGKPLTTPDVWVDDVALAVMVHSRQFHGDELDFEATVDDDEDLRSAGVEVVTVTPRGIARNPQRILARVSAGYERAVARPRPPLTATPKDYLGLATG